MTGTVTPPPGTFQERLPRGERSPADFEFVRPTGAPDDARTLADWMALLLDTRTVYSVDDFGAAGDGVTDDTAAIQLAIDALRSEVASIGGTSSLLPSKVLFSPGKKYRITTLDLQNILAWGWSVEGYGAVILAAGSGKAALDCLGSRYGALRGLTIVGDATDAPAIGVQLARPGNAQTGGEGFRITDCTLVGKFTRAGIYNLAGETGVYTNLYIRNTDTAGGVAMIIDGLNHLGPITDFDDTTIVTDTVQSCTQHTFIHPDLRVPSGGAPVFVAYHATQIRMVNGFMAGTGPAIKHVVVDGKGDTVKDADYDAHCELVTNNIVFERTEAGSVIAEGVKLRDIASQASDSFIKAGSDVTLYLEDADVHCFDYSGTLLGGTIGGFGGSVNGQPVSWYGIGDSAKTLSPAAGTLGVKGKVARFALTAALTSSRTWTLPAAADVPKGFRLQIVDSVGGISASATLTIARASSGDSINGGANYILRSPYAAVTLVSDGSTTWIVEGEAIGNTGAATPTPTPASGSFTTVSATTKWRLLGKMCHFQANVTITDKGTGTGSVRVPLPFTAGANSIIPGTSLAITGKMLQGKVNSGGTTCNIFNYDNSSPIADSETLTVSGWYEIA